MTPSQIKTKLGDTTIIVSGFPRSGTSLTMRMLVNGGVEALADSKLKNKMAPHGTLELKDVGKWLLEHPGKEHMRGRVFKLVAPYIREFLPVQNPLKVIFVTRDINEIIASLMANANVWEYEPHEAISDAMEVFRYHGTSVHKVDYKDLISYPKSTSIGIADFLDLDLDIDKMVSAVDMGARTRHLTDTENSDYGDTGSKRKIIPMSVGGFGVEGKEDIKIENDAVIYVDVPKGATDKEFKAMEKAIKSGDVDLANTLRDKCKRRLHVPGSDTNPG